MEGKQLINSSPPLGKSMKTNNKSFLCVKPTTSIKVNPPKESLVTILLEDNIMPEETTLQFELHFVVL